MLGLTSKLGSKFPNGTYQNIPDSLYESTEIPKFVETPLEDISVINSELKAYFDTGVTKTYEWRIKQLKQIKLCLLENEISIVKALELDFKRRDIALFELHLCLDEVILVLENLKNWIKPTKLNPSWLFFLDELTEERVPLGVMLNISPWNLPIYLMFSPLIGMVAAGNCVCFKPSEISPNTAALMKDLVERYLDPNAFRVINGGVDVATEVLNQRWDHIMYTGNSQVGKIVMKAASEHLTPVTLELGGKSPTLIDTKTSNLETVCNRVLSTKALNWGQVCLSTDYIIVLKGESDKLIEQMKKTVKKFFGEDYKENTKAWGPMINQRHTKRVVDLIPTGEIEGEGEVVIGGNFDIEAKFIEMTVIKNVNPYTSKLMKEEIFGPLIPIVEFDTWEQAFKFIRSNEKPLGAYLYTQDNRLINSFKSNVVAGSQAINESVIQFVNLELNFGGVGNSGLGGGYHGYNSFKTFTYGMPILKRSQALEFINWIRYSPRDLANTYPCMFPTMFNLVGGHGAVAQWVNYPFKLAGWAWYTTKLVAKTAIGF
ncbi:aldehyde dehydrogenase [Conidiobolus coronatus NRRL 28638]|uniref:Aldehyde dehydrogenase n=1 Tax=Conidiobolus coronatus (strain ATCC 28846 / CBS 209.66 / NRRL 28638) TaxID=796925 RepID=A0A137P5T7_CONC2|nr:aldehyde dehydrogenase [Conidiobolus coronatus NRRL 28638]|eukprot:KXN70378.1 aldehyde dehydrogenase [Conidiobolus coronatus NRRL 28638]